MVLSGCATTLSQAEINSLWVKVSAKYSECDLVPKMTYFDIDARGAYYVPSIHTVYIDKYASHNVWKHVFRHACGDEIDDQHVKYLRLDKVYK